MKLATVLLIILSFSFSAKSQVLDWYNAYETSTIYDNLVWNDMAFDNNENILQVGYFVGNVDSDPTGGVQAHSTNAPSVLIQKVSPLGIVLWTKAIIGSGILGVASNEIQTDNANNVYIGGFFENSADFDPGSGVETLSANGIEDGFVLKLNENGDFVYVNQLRQGRAGELRHLEINKATQEVYYITPFQEWIDVDPSANNIIVNEHTNNYNDNGVDNTVTICFNSNGTYKWHYYLGIDGGDGNRGLYVMQNNDVIILPTWSTTDSIDVNPSSGVSKIKRQPLFGGFQRNLVRLDANGNFISARQIHFNSDDVSGSYTYFEFDENENLILTGLFENTVDFALDGTSFVKSSAGNLDVFIVRYTPTFQIDTSYFIQGPSLQSIQYINVDKRNVLHLLLRSDATVDVDQSPNSVVQRIGRHYLKLDYSDFSFISSFDWNSDLFGPRVSSIDRTWVYFKNSMTNGESVEMDPTVGNTTYTNTGQGNASVVCQWQICTSSTSSNVDFISCESSFTSPSGKYIWNSVGTYQDTVYNSEGCDSIMTINLSFASETFSSINAYGCNSYSSPSGQTYSVDGLYQDTIPNHSGCDSIITINLSLGEARSEIFPIECESSGAYISPSGKSFTSAGQYEDTIPSQSGCDSIITIYLSFESESIQNITLTGCQSIFLPSGVEVFEDGIYQDTVPSMNGCDSIFIVDATLGIVRSSATENSCFSFTFPSGKTAEQSGLYFDTIPSVNGCDSIIEFDLTISSFNSGIINVSPNLAATQGGAVYQWLDCNDGYAEISGANSQIFSPTENGLYAVEITYDGCTAISGCEEITELSLSENTLINFNIYPNPAEDLVYLKADSHLEEVKVTNSLGKVVFISSERKKEIKIDFADFASGVYFVSFLIEGEFITSKIVRL